MHDRWDRHSHPGHVCDSLTDWPVSCTLARLNKCAEQGLYLESLWLLHGISESDIVVWCRFIRPVRRDGRSMGSKDDWWARRCGGSGAATEAGVDSLTCMTTCEGSEHRCCYHLLRKGGGNSGS